MLTLKNHQPQIAYSQNVKNTVSSKVTANVLHNLLNESLETGRFPDNLKLALE